MKAQGKKKRPKTPTTEELMELLRRGARSANELDRTLKRVFTLTPAQLHMRFD